MRPTSQASSGATCGGRFRARRPAFAGPASQPHSPSVQIRTVPCRRSLYVTGAEGRRDGQVKVSGTVPPPVSRRCILTRWTGWRFAHVQPGRFALPQRPGAGVDDRPGPRTPPRCSILETATGRARSAWQCPKRTAHALAFSPDGREAGVHVETGPPPGRRRSWCSTPARAPSSPNQAVPAMQTGSYRLHPGGRTPGRVRDQRRAASLHVIETGKDGSCSMPGAS